MTAVSADALRAAQFLIRHMYRPVGFSDGEPYFAISETEQAIGGDQWFWNDDNAKALEFLSLPEVAQRFPTEIAEILRFVRGMCRGPFIFRRVSTPRLEAIPGEIEHRGLRLSGYIHSLMQLKFNLKLGGVIAGVRFHDERSVDNLILTGNRVEFIYRARRYRVPIEPHISDGAATQDGHRLLIRHSGELYFKPRRRPLRLGRFDYSYGFDARSSVITAEATLDLDAQIEVSDVVLTIGHAYLDYNGFAHIAAYPDRGEPLLSRSAAGTQVLPLAGASYYAIRQPDTSGDANAIHTIPEDGAPLAAIEATLLPNRKLGRALALYRFSGPQRGARLRAREYKLLTAGGFYDRLRDYSSFVREAVAGRESQTVAYDFSISYDYGVVLNAFAKCFATIRGSTGSTMPDLPDTLRQLFDQYLSFYFELYLDRHEQQPNTLFSRELAFVMLGLVTMYRATREEVYRHRLRRLCEVLLEFEVRFEDLDGGSASGFLMRLNSPRAAYVDCHSAALLALTRAAELVDDPRLPAAIDRGLASYCLETCRVEAGQSFKVDTIATSMVDAHGTRRTADAYWNFKVGITLRFFQALRQAHRPELRQIAARHRERMALLEMIMRDQLRRSTTEHEDGTEIRCSVHASETNSETQPWVMLGLLGHPCD